ncbi:peptidyl-prolyl cis-trans isomerase [Klebsiella pneumoniae]|uniref:Peptidyl-prolyl cis-trans isomerase n=1 Tax=Klebsiella pneumoniae TaxID=573 RepID=A0A2X3EBC8_KLEPN|nr:peptidyl-prolyl cis-trans isomerase [Klebsiella pneumoniae]
MATPTFDTIEAQASYGIGLQVGQQLSESGLQGLLPEALVAVSPMRWKVTSRRCRWKPFTARCVKSTSVLTLCVASVFRPWPLTAKNTLMKTARKRV